jgi:hypothetical protein
MRSIFIQKPLEFRLEVPIEFGGQGDPAPCTLSVRNHSEERVPLSELSLQLALGDLKKVKAKDAQAFRVLATAELDRSAVLMPNASLSVVWDLVLDINAPITDKAQSLFFLYGNSSSTSLLGQLPLTVKMHPHLRAIFDTCETVFGLSNRGESWRDGFTTVKFQAPDLRKFSLVDEISIGARFVDGGAVELIYNFKVKKIAATAHSLNFKKGRVEVAQTWRSEEYLFGGGFIRQDFIDKSLEEAFSAVATGF